MARVVSPLPETSPELDPAKAAQPQHKRPAASSSSRRGHKAETEARSARSPQAHEVAQEHTRRPDSRDAFRLARQTWRAGERLDMTALARELGVNRVTLYRWVGSREQLLVAVIWNLASHALRVADEEVKETGSERVTKIVSSFIDQVISHHGMQTWLANEGESAMRLLTRHQAGFQPRLAEWLERLLHEELDAKRLDLPIDVHEVAYVLEQLIESYVYLFPITGEQPEARRAEPILRMLLR